MKCPSCGESVDQGAAFCGNCGNPLQILAPQVPVANTPVSTAPTAIPLNPQPTQPNIPTTVPPANDNGAQTMQNVIQNQQPVVPQPINISANNLNSTNAGSIPIPAYAIPKQGATAPGETKSIVALILGIIGIPASIVPILGIALGVTGLILATISRAKYKHVLNILAIIFSSMAILVAIGLWILAFQQSTKNHQNVSVLNSATSNTTSTPETGLTSVNTPCYKVKIDSGLQNYSPTGCDFDAQGTSEEFTVSAATSLNVTTSNLATVGQKALADAASTINAKITSEKLGQFAGSPAYIAYMDRPGFNQEAIMAVVLQKTADGENVFVVIHVTVGNQAASFGPLESNWVWK